MHRLALTILALALLATGCGDGSGFGGATSAPTTAAGETTLPTVPTTPPTTIPEGTAPSTTVPVEATSTTAGSGTSTAPGHYYEVDPAHFFPDPFPGAGDVHGSGCVTPGFDALPDGVWFGFVEGIADGEVAFDLACFFTGEAAVDAAAEDGEEAFDFYIRNHVATQFRVFVAPDARVWYIDMTSPDVTNPVEIPLASWPTPDSFQDCPSDHCAVWLYVNGGQVTGIVEQYLP